MFVEFDVDILYFVVQIERGSHRLLPLPVQFTFNLALGWLWEVEMRVDLFSGNGIKLCGVFVCRWMSDKQVESRIFQKFSFQRQLWTFFSLLLPRIKISWITLHISVFQFWTLNQTFERQKRDGCVMKNLQSKQQQRCIRTVRWSGKENDDMKLPFFETNWNLLNIFHSNPREIQCWSKIEGITKSLKFRKDQNVIW